MEIVILIIGIIQGVVFGFATNQIIKNKGYSENWFWWGFFFSFLAVIVAATKPDNHPNQQVVIKSEIPQKFPKPVITKALSSNEFADKVDINSPIHITSWKIQKENDDLCLYIQFLNVSDISVSAVMFNVAGFNSFTDNVKVDGEDEFEVIGQDYSVYPGMHETLKTLLPSKDIRKVDIKVKKVCFSNDKIYEPDECKWINTKQKLLEDRYIECVREENDKGNYYSIIEQDYWQCVCGFVNTGEVCRFCGMKKDVASKFTMNQMTDTYDKYLIELEEERIKEEEIRNEAERMAEIAERKRQEEAEQERIRLQKDKKFRRKITAICGSILMIVVIGTVSIVFISKSRKYENDRANISSYIAEEEYDSAFNLMISSDNDDKLADEFGDIIWKKEKKLDNSFMKDSFKHASNADKMQYIEDKARNGVCYYSINTDETSESHYSETEYIYAVTSDQSKIKLFERSAYDKKGYVFIEGLANKAFEDDFYDTIWSNGWLFLSVSIKDVDRSGGIYALKYDEDKNKAYEVKVTDETPYNSYCYLKMKDGNIVISLDQNLNNIKESRKLKIFDVVNGNVSDTSYSKLNEKYDSDIKGNILIMCEE